MGPCLSPSPAGRTAWSSFTSCRRQRLSETAASDADQRFVEERCRENGVPCVAAALPIRDLAKDQKANVEDEARRRRYRWLKEQAEAAGASWLATAHHADDQAETVLHHLLRGTHLGGLRGIAPRRRLGQGLWLIRPF